MSSAPNHPAYACVVTRSWDPHAAAPLPGGITPGLRVYEGDEVWVFQTYPPGTTPRFGFTHRPIRNNTSYQRGWVDLRYLRLGEPRARPLPIELPAANQSFGQGPATATQPPENVLHNTLRDLWRTVKASESTLKNVIPGMSDISSGILFHQNAHKYGDVVYRCITPEARNIMSSGRFDIQTLGTLQEVSPQWPNQSGVYLIIYYGLDIKTGNQTFQVVIYIGQTMDFQSRKTRHQRNAQNSNSIHYRLARRATSMRMVPILIQSGGNLPPSFLDIAEFSFVCLFRSWYAALFRPSDTSVVGAYATDFDACLAFSGLMRDVSNRTGWAPGRTYGVNWQTPVLTSPRADVQWTSWYSEPQSMFIYRTRRRVVEGSKSCDIYWQSGRKVNLPVELVREAGFESGQTVHLVVEVKKNKDGQYLTHPFRFVRYPPRIGANTELEKLRSLAVQVQWLDKQGQWKSYYLERQRTWIPMKNSNVPEIHRLALFILCNVEQTVYNNAPAWTLSTAPARINYLRYDHLQQKFFVEVRQVQHKDWPANNTIANNTQRLLQLFPSGPDANTVIGQRPENTYAFFGTSRTACDICFSQSTSTACRYDAATQTCQNCVCLNRPCTFSRSDGELIQEFLHGHPLEELGIAPHMARGRTSLVRDLRDAPFDPDIEGEAHGPLADN